MHGYKTFASKTAFNFPGQITAIVGTKRFRKIKYLRLNPLGIGGTSLQLAAR